MLIGHCKEFLKLFFGVNSHYLWTHLIEPNDDVYGRF